MRPAARPPVTAEDIGERVRTAVLAAQDRKALELRVLRVEAVCDFTDYFLLCSGTSERQVQAIAEGVEESLLEQHGIRPLHVEGLRQGKWVLLDFGDFVVHIFDQERRQFYRLDRLWSDGDEVTAEYAR
jgi:ribosome-associated protein